VRTPDWAVAGTSFVGTPGFAAGHNGVAAWGNTAGLLDNTDLFIEEIGSDGQSVRQGDRFVPCERRIETILVKGGQAVQEVVLIGPRGPIIGPALEGEVGAIALCATWLDPRPVQGMFGVHRARSFREFRRAFERWPVVPFNMVYADTSGTVGWQLAGQAPRRRKGWGTIPLPGWDTEVGWEDDAIPFAEMPHLADPDVGFVATANSRPTPEGEGPYLGVDWCDGYRLARIVEALDARRDWDIAGTQALQLDQACLPWRELRDVVLAIPAGREDVRRGLALLEGWDGVLGVGSPAAAVCEFFVSEMTRRVVEAKAPRAARWARGRGFTPLVAYTMFTGRRVSHMVRLARAQPEGWFERPWAEEMADALAAVVRILRERYGEDPERWAWGHIRPLTLRHSAGDRAPLDRIFNLGPFPWGGDGNTIGQAGGDLADPASNPLWIASMRMVIDVGNWEESRFALPGGQSGNPLSPHYDDLLPFWQRGEGVPIAWSPARVEQGARAALRLVPGEEV
jgi:penicillin amidase